MNDGPRIKTVRNLATRQQIYLPLNKAGCLSEQNQKLVDSILERNDSAGVIPPPAKPANTKSAEA